ncbi:MAG: hypothetical protein A2Y15_06140 [Clostridiales bacterium GWF2_36_10]|nr:MAG: hypothetical protein A2Y15_06140 [Clostridiales bacterium GWF2_36_10]HAN21904.1 hypothetical protein [Clostridiales bacterium]
MSETSGFKRYIGKGKKGGGNRVQDNKINKVCDKAIIEFLEGDKNGLSVIYDCMARMIFSVAYAIVGNYQDAEDVLQDTMIEITKYAHTYRKGSNAKAWILTMTRHLSIDLIRKRKPTFSLDEVETLEQSTVVCTEFSQLEVLEMLNALDEDENQIVIFRLYAEMSYIEISQIMGISIASAQKKYQRSIKKLKNNII